MYVLPAEGEELVATTPGLFPLPIPLLRVIPISTPILEDRLLLDHIHGANVHALVGLQPQRGGHDVQRGLLSGICLVVVGGSYYCYRLLGSCCLIYGSNSS